ncbi:MucR family transcriptional regulator [Streptomyces sp. NPDC003442]
MCHECGKRYRMLTTHLIRAHGLTADQYRLAHGIAPHQPLESASTSVKKTANGHRVYEQRPDIRAALGGGTVPPTLARGPAVSRCTRQCGAAGPVRRYTSGALARRPHRCLQRLEEIGGPDHACRPVGLPAVPRYAPWSVRRERRRSGLACSSSIDTSCPRGWSAYWSPEHPGSGCVRRSDNTSVAALSRASPDAGLSEPERGAGHRRGESEECGEQDGRQHGSLRESGSGRDHDTLMPARAEPSSEKNFAHRRDVSGTSVDSALTRSHISLHAGCYRSIHR